MTNQAYRQQETEIDLKEVIWGLLSQWKAVLIVALLAALLVCGAKHMKDVRSYNAGLEAEKEAANESNLSAEERIAEVMNALPEDERTTVDYVVSEQEWVDEQKEYLQESILMRTNPTNQRELHLIYDIDAENGADLAVLAQSYNTYVNSEKIAEAIKPYIAAEAADKYISELLYSSNSAINLIANDESKSTEIRISIVLPEDADADGVSKAITDEFKAYSKELKSKYAHAVTLATQTDSHVFHKDNTNMRMSIFNNINNLETNLKNAQSTLSDGQKAAIEKITAIKAEYKAMDEEAVQADTSADSIGSGDSAENENAENTAPGWSKKYALLGFILGCIAYAFIYVLRLIMRGRVNSASDVENYTGARLLGEVYTQGEHKGLSALLHSKLVDKYHYRGKLDADAQVSKIASSLEAICDHAGTKSVTLFNLTPTSEELNNVLKTVSDAAKKNGVKIEAVGVSDEVDEKGLLEAKNAVIAAGNETRTATLSRLTALCADYDINILGTVYIMDV